MAGEKSHFQFGQNPREVHPEKTYISTAWTITQIFHTKTTQNRMPVFNFL